MIIPILQAMLLIAAGVGLLRLWRAARPVERWLRWVVTVGFLSRLIFGQVLFWISWGHLPVARGLQLGNGLWFFALDALGYYRTAASTAADGLWAIVTLPRTVPSVIMT